MSRPKQIIYPLRYFSWPSSSSEQLSEQFEANLAAFLGDGIHVRALGRARAGLYLLVKLCMRAGRKRAILSPYTVPDVVNMVRFAGAEPVFVDFVQCSTNIDVDHLASLVDDSVCCVILTHYHFNQSTLDDVRKICAASDVVLVEDCALALGASESGHRIGTTTDAAVFSFSGFKTLNFFRGGAIATRSPQLARRIDNEINQWRRLRWPQYFEQMVRLLRYDLLTRNLPFSALTFPLLRRKALHVGDAEILPVVRVESKQLDGTHLSRPCLRAIKEWDRKLSSIDKFTAHRRSIAAIYDEALEQYLVARETPAAVRAGSCLVNYPVSISSERRTRVYKKIIASGFDIGLSLYPNVHEMQGFDRIAGRSHSVSRLVRSVITLPTHPRIFAQYASRLAKVTRDALLTA